MGYIHYSTSLRLLIKQKKQLRTQKCKELLLRKEKLSSNPRRKKGWRGGGKEIWEEGEREGEEQRNRKREGEGGTEERTEGGKKKQANVEVKKYGNTFTAIKGIQKYFKIMYYVF
jgi:hypothetical protein